MDPGQLSSITRYELAQTVNIESTDLPRGHENNGSSNQDVDSKDKPRALSDDRAMEFDEEDEDEADKAPDG